MPPPVFSLTPPQRRALEALDWLHDGTEDYRRTGRSTVLALSYLRRLIVNPARSRDREGWLEVEDHVAGERDLDRHLVQTIQALAAEIGFHGVEVHPSRVRIRIRSDARISRGMIEALTRFGERVEPDLQPLYQRRLYRRDTPTPETAAKPVTLWDHLADD